jgi:hypothetical protein
MNRRRPFRRLARRFGRSNEKAAVAVAHTLARIAWTVIRHGHSCAEAGEDHCHQRDCRAHDHLARHDRQALARLGYQVALIPPGDGGPLPAQAA